jgi:hypothetical protein
LPVHRDLSKGAVVTFHPIANRMLGHLDAMWIALKEQPDRKDRIQDSAASLRANQEVTLESTSAHPGG